MTVPKLDIPTDNLYKFGAILSTVMCLTCIITAAVLLNSFLDEAKQEMYRTTDYINKYSTNSIEQRNFVSNVNSYLEARGKVLYASSMVLGVFIAVSFILSIKFYFLWYKKVQIHLDKLLVLKLRKEEECLTNNSK